MPPRKLAVTKTNTDGNFDLTFGDAREDAGVLYLIADGGEAKTAARTGQNPAIVLMATLGTEPPERVTVNELTTVASVWTAAQFLNGSAMSGNATGLRIAAGHNQAVHIPGGDASKGRILGRTVEGKPVDGALQVKAPFGIAIDQQDRIWIGNSASNTITRFPASDPGKAEEIEVGYSPHGIAIDSRGNVWVAGSTSHSLTQLCGVRTDNCPPGHKTGDPISPQSGDIGGLQIITAVAIDPAGNAWVANSWNDTEAGFSEDPDEVQSTRFASHTNVVFFGVAKPVRTPLIGPVKAP